MVNIVANFLLGLLATLLIAGAARWIANRFTSEGGKIASFGAACGYTVGKYSVVKPAGMDMSDIVAGLTGALVALVVLWFLLFRLKDQAVNR